MLISVICWTKHHLAYFVCVYVCVYTQYTHIAAYTIVQWNLSGLYCPHVMVLLLVLFKPVSLYWVPAYLDGHYAAGGQAMSDRSRRRGNKETAQLGLNHGVMGWERRKMMGMRKLKCLSWLGRGIIWVRGDRRQDVCIIPNGRTFNRLYVFSHPEMKIICDFYNEVGRMNGGKMDSKHNDLDLSEKGKCKL